MYKTYWICIVVSILVKFLSNLVKKYFYTTEKLHEKWKNDIEHFATCFDKASDEVKIKFMIEKAFEIKTSNLSNASHDVPAFVDYLRKLKNDNYLTHKWQSKFILDCLKRYLLEMTKIDRKVAIDIMPERKQVFIELKSSHDDNDGFKKRCKEWNDKIDEIIDIEDKIFKRKIDALDYCMYNNEKSFIENVHSNFEIYRFFREMGMEEETKLVIYKKQYNNLSPFESLPLPGELIHLNIDSFKEKVTGIFSPIGNNPTDILVTLLSNIEEVRNFDDLSITCDINSKGLRFDLPDLPTLFSYKIKDLGKVWCFHNVIKHKFNSLVEAIKVTSKC